MRFFALTITLLLSLVFANTARAERLRKATYDCEDGSQMIVLEDCDLSCPIKYIMNSAKNFATSEGTIHFNAVDPFGTIVDSQGARVGTVRAKKKKIFIAILYFSSVCKR